MANAVAIIRNIVLLADVCKFRLCVHIISCSLSHPHNATIYTYVMVHTSRCVHGDTESKRKWVHETWTTVKSSNLTRPRVRFHFKWALRSLQLHITSEREKKNRIACTLPNVFPNATLLSLHRNGEPHRKLRNFWLISFNCCQLQRSDIDYYEVVECRAAVDRSSPFHILFPAHCST